MAPNMHALVDILIGIVLHIRLILPLSQIHHMLEPPDDQHHIPRVNWNWDLFMDIAPYVFFALAIILAMIFLP